MVPGDLDDRAAAFAPAVVTARGLHCSTVAGPFFDAHFPLVPRHLIDTNCERFDGNRVLGTFTCKEVAEPARKVCSFLV